MNHSADFPCIKDQVSAEEWQARVDLAACYRLVDMYDMTDLIYNHITVRIPGTEHLLINLYGLTYKEITASSLAKIDVEGNIIWKPDTDYGINVAGYVIHGAIHKARPDVNCVTHTHTRAGMAVSAMKCGLLPLSQTGIRFHGRIGYHDYEGPAINIEERVRLVQSLGEHDAMILRSHGLLTCGANIPMAFNTLYQHAAYARELLRPARTGGIAGIGGGCVAPGRRNPGRASIDYRRARCRSDRRRSRHRPAR